MDTSSNTTIGLKNQSGSVDISSKKKIRNLDELSHHCYFSSLRFLSLLFIQNLDDRPPVRHIASIWIFTLRFYPGSLSVKGCWSTRSFTDLINLFFLVVVFGLIVFSMPARSVGQRHVILSPIDAHYKWPQNKIYLYVS